MTEPLLPTRFLFRFAVPCLYRQTLWTAHGVQLDEAHRLPSFAELEGRPTYADVRAAWSEAGVALSVRVEGKRHAPWCRDTRAEDSDGFRVWLDTRDVHNIHRAGRFCHAFVFLPFGSGRKLDQPFADQVLINRARENPKPVRPGQLKVRSEKRIDGYILEAFIPADALTGFDPMDHPRLGFTYAVADREMGEQTFGVGSPFPFHEDPSLWGTLELARP